MCTTTSSGIRTFFSHRKSSRCTFFDLCGGNPDTGNIAARVLADLAKLLFDPDGAGASLARPLLAYFRLPSAHWPQDVLEYYQQSVLTAFSKIWRPLVHAFQVYPWALVPAFNRDLPEPTRKACGQALFDAHVAWPCTLDPYATLPLVTHLCGDVEALFEEELEDFLHTLMSRSVPVSTFVERIFAPLTKATREPQTRQNFYTLVGQHLRSAWTSQVQRWKELFVDIAASGSKTRDPTAYPTTHGSHTCGWHEYVRARPPAPGLSIEDKCKHNRDLQKEWKELPPAAKAPALHEAARKRAMARTVPSPLDKHLQELAAAETPAGPWGMASMSGGKPEQFPLGTFEVERVCQGRNAVARLSEAFAARHDKVLPEAPDWPDDVDYAAPCHPSECTHALSDAQRALFHELSGGIRLALRHSGTPASSPVCLQLRSAAHVVYACFQDVAGTVALNCVVARMVEVPEGEGRDFGPVSLAFSKGDVRLDTPWPVVMSETAFLLLLVATSAGPWAATSIHTIASGSSSRKEYARKPLPWNWLREQEVLRLEQLHALRLLAKVSDVPLPGSSKKAGGKGLGRRRGGGRGRGDVGGHSGSSEED